MLIMLTVVVAAALLIYGILTDSQPLVIAAGVISMITIVALVGGRLFRSRHGTDDGERDTADDRAPVPEPAATRPDDLVAAEPDPARMVRSDQPYDPPSSEPDQIQVVFLVGRTTFHLPTCSVVADRSVSSGTRSGLEAQGMTRCRRCLAS